MCIFNLLHERDGRTRLSFYDSGIALSVFVIPVDTETQAMYLLVPTTKAICLSARRKGQA
jgi:hypothetical protein